MEITKEVKVTQVDYKCPKCKRGRLRPTGSALLSRPPYLHKCNNTVCDYEETFESKIYPYIDSFYKHRAKQ